MPAVFYENAKKKTLAFERVSQIMCVKLPSVSKWERVVLTDGASVNKSHLLLHRRTVHYANQQLWRGWNQEGDKKPWQMKRMILSDINVALNHIREGFKFQHIYLLSTVTALSSHSSPVSSHYLPVFFRYPSAIQSLL